MPPIGWARGPCPGCGALTEDEAGAKCKPTTDETGERSCIGYFDKDGFSVNETPESLEAMNAWIDAHHDCGDECEAKQSEPASEPLRQILADALQADGQKDK